MAASRPALPTRWFLLPVAVLAATFLAALVHFATRDSAEWAGLVDGALALSYLVGAVVVGGAVGRRGCSRSWPWPARWC